jgi:hypothetical protein
MVPMGIVWSMGLLPEDAPGRLPTSLPSSLDNIAVSPPVLNITGLIVASSLARFERAAAEVRKSDIRSTVWIPSYFLSETNYSLCGGGANGLRHAMRNAWNLIATTGIGMAVFEEDVSYAVPTTSNASVSHYVQTRCLEAKKRCHLAYLGEWNGFFTTHAIYVPPQTAADLLRMTDSCYPWKAQIDQTMHARCANRPGRVPWECVKPPGFTKPGCFGKGFFVQDSKAVPSFLHGRGSHGKGNVAIARRDRLL